MGFLSDIHDLEVENVKLKRDLADAIRLGGLTMKAWHYLAPNQPYRHSLLHATCEHPTCKEWRDRFKEASDER